MSGLDLEAVHEALADQIRAGIGDAGSFTIKAFPSEAARPVMEVWPGEDGDYISYFETSGASGLADVNLVVRFYLSGANPESEWRMQARLTSAGDGHPSSVIGAIMADRTLGGAVADAFTPSARWNPQEGVVEIPVAIQLNKIGGPV